MSGTILPIIFIVIGIAVCAVGIYEFTQSKDDPESKKIYTITAVLGALVAVAAILKLVLT